MIFNVPIEPIPMRYSVDWQKWFMEYWGSKGIKVHHVHGIELTKGIEEGRFLDCVGTNYYKSSQLMAIMQWIKRGVLESGDTLFFHDLWFPGIEQIAYACDALNLNIRICGCLHAGAYDPNDFLYQSGMGRWAVHFENMLLEIVDKVFLATEYHEDLIMKSRTVNPDKLIVTGFPIKFDQVDWSNEKENLIVFPHRPDPEKNPHIFTKIAEALAPANPDWKFINTRHCDTKEEYYKTLGKCKIAISTSDQETWGIAMQECVASGCIPLVPDKLSYREMYHKRYRYTDYFDLIALLQSYIVLFDTNKDAWKDANDTMLKGQKWQFSNSGNDALFKITEELVNDYSYKV